MADASIQLNPLNVSVSREDLDHDEIAEGARRKAWRQPFFVGIRALVFVFEKWRS
ncbi:hypothetical protein QA649_05030 [Bradyrhizobium sp. CB1717]|uniref:hypothetical protein n=1 Tax=Bradyrhizobium sp. CB1717 TaxID=3039154 RepID=UPI0024B21C87|nr:hypothetical protein [Bradyrhizobium sp. CB1717]WFU25576.1 hypothetical protein QA649_05030 [Bradyrhizobium sp. CB1717]